MSKTQKNRNNYMKINYFLEFICSFDANVNTDVSFTDLLEDTGRCGNSAFYDIKVLYCLGFHFSFFAD